MKKIMMMVLMMALVCGSAFAVENENNLILSNNESPFFFLKALGEDIRLAVTFDNGKKAELYMTYAQRRTDEMSQIIKRDTLEKRQQRFENQLEMAYIYANNQTKVDEVLDKHIEVLMGVKERVPNTAIVGMEKALEKSQEIKEQRKGIDNRNNRGN